MKTIYKTTSLGIAHDLSANEKYISKDVLTSDVYNNEFTNIVRLSSYNYSNYASKIKSQREDFNDMFRAEHTMRTNRGDISTVFCLTYNDEHIFRKYGRNLLNADDLKKYSKSSSWYKSIRDNLGYTFDYVCVGEYGEGGQSHNYVGKRGAGNNPHYHCVGWFHQIEKLDPDKACSFIERYIGLKVKPKVLEDNIKHYLNLLIRYNWQKCLIDDSKVYGSSKKLRSLGLGYVHMAGEVASASGGTYISKYIGKDIRKVFMDAYFIYFCPKMLEHLSHSIKAWYINRGISYPENISSIIYYWASTNNNECVRSRMLTEFKQYLSVYRNDIYPYFLNFDFNFLDTIYINLYDIFLKDMNGKHSPKVRKFHGFGYSLINDANINDGTYVIHRPKKDVHRKLPPSLFRHLYYNYNVCVNHRGDKVVRYTINENGFKMLYHVLPRIYNKLFDIAKSKGSENLKDNIVPACNFLAFLANYDILEERFDEAAFINSLTNSLNAIRHNISCRSFYVLESVPEKRTFIDTWSYLRNYDSCIYDAVCELKELHIALKQTKNDKDLDYNSNWFKCFNFNY